MSSKQVLASLMISIVTLAIAGPHAMAHEGATGVVKQRMEFMKSLGQAMKGFGDMLKGKTAYEPALAAEYASTIGAHSQRLLDQFPEGSNQPPSEALPEIWQDWPEFEKISRRLEAESTALAATVNGPEKAAAVLAQYVKVGKACGACHERFRVPKDD